MDESFLYDLLAKTNLLLQDGDRRFFQGFGLSQARYYALFHIQQDPGLSLTELSRRLLCTKGNTTRILASLAADGFLDRKTAAADQRTYQLQVSAEGQALFEHVSAAYDQYNQERFANLNNDQKLVLSQLLQQLSDDLREQLH